MVCPEAGACVGVVQARWQTKARLPPPPILLSTHILSLSHIYHMKN
jgi:hypothetical protein